MYSFNTYYFNSKLIIIIMSLFDSTEKLYSELPDKNKNKRLSNLLGTKSLLAKIRNIPKNEICIYYLKIKLILE